MFAAGTVVIWLRLLAHITNKPARVAKVGAEADFALAAILSKRLLCVAIVALHHFSFVPWENVILFVIMAQSAWVKLLAGFTLLLTPSDVVAASNGLILSIFNKNLLI